MRHGFILKVGALAKPTGMGKFGQWRPRQFLGEWMLIGGTYAAGIGDAISAGIDDFVVVHGVLFLVKNHPNNRKPSADLAADLGQRRMSYNFRCVFGIRWPVAKASISAWSTGDGSASPRR